MILQDLHTHSAYDDGRGTLLEIAESAHRKGIASVGFSGHSPLPFANDWAMTGETLRVYMEEAQKVKENMRGRTDIFLGIEYDCLSDVSLDPFDYVIGSVHHLKCGGTYLSVDESVERAEQVIAYFGSADLAAQAYFALVGQLAENDQVDIIGHFDLITKFNERKKLYNTESPAYILAANSAMERLVQAGKIFEINTGAVSRGYRSEPYPSKALLSTLKQMGGRITITSDAHSPENLCYGFQDVKALAAACGFTEVWQYVDGAFRPVTL